LASLPHGWFISLEAAISAVSVALIDRKSLGYNLLSADDHH
jgi:hypothetical protein